MELSKRQEQIIKSRASKIVVIASAASGKAQPNSTVIPTPEGYKKIGELKPGDQVFNRFGKAERILQVFPQGKKQIYEVTLADGRVTRCCGEHLWSYDNTKGGLATKTIEEMCQKGLYRLDKRGHKEYRYRIPNLKSPVEYEKKQLEIDPYVLGCFLGDGCCLESALTISSSDEELVKNIAERIGAVYKKSSQYGYSWYFCNKNGEKIRTKVFFKGYEEYLCKNCHEKRIPEDYLLGSQEQRLELLRGLMDTDGYTGNGKNSPNYSTTNFLLAQDVAELSRSLGYYTTIYTNNRKDKKSIEYTVNIFTSHLNAFSIFKLKRKVEKALSFKNNPCRINHNFISIIDIKITEEFEEMSCIYVDHPEHLYLTNNFIVTHNTRILTERIRWLLETGIPAEEIVALTFTNNAANEIYERLGSPKGLFVGTIHGYANRILLRAGKDTSKILNNEKFDDLFKMIEDLYFLHPEKFPEIRHLLLDEAQDISSEQFSFVLDYLKPKNYLIVGDYRQSIYQFRDARPDILMNLVNDPMVMTYQLNENYRNAANILYFAKRIISKNGYDYRDLSVPMRGIEGIATEVDYSLERLVNLINGHDSYKDWFVLARTNSEIEEVSSYLKKRGIPVDTFRQADLSNEELAEKMSENSVKVLTIHSSKGLEAKNVFVIGARYYNDEEVCVSYVAATRAMNRLYWCSGKRKKRELEKNVVQWE